MCRFRFKIVYVSFCRLYKNSSPIDDSFYFKYYIDIENLRSHEVKLLKRKWVVYDTGFGFTEVSGDGVIGLTPKIKPGEVFTYFSHVNIHSGIGNMQGKYLFIDVETEDTFEVEIPKFSLLATVLSN
ncbi:MAG: ApaG domain [Cloacibacterium sp.]|nr:ApaG domain [Cloacibacterium sp.]